MAQVSTSQGPDRCFQCSRRAFDPLLLDRNTAAHPGRTPRVTSVRTHWCAHTGERFHPRRFLSSGNAQKDRNVNQLFTCWTLTDVHTNRFCDIHLPRSKLQSQLCWCKPGQTPEVWESLHLHQDKQKQQCPLAEIPSPLFLCCTCGSASQCPGTISAHWRRRRRWLLHPGETSHNLSHIKMLPLFLSQEDSVSSQCSVPSPCPCWGGLMESCVRPSST